ncbi:hypothetical protein FRC11_012631 [Ceratobasidium sp. 423]|nr:hypothetical protein FRC11_012631 [Ceratobasidium sp. 423]
MSDELYHTADNKEGPSAPIPPPVAPTILETSSIYKPTTLAQQMHQLQPPRSHSLSTPYYPPVKPHLAHNHTPTPSLSDEPTPRLKPVIATKQRDIPVIYEKFTTYTNQATVKDMFSVDINITAAELRTEVMAHMEVSDTEHLVYSFTGVPKSESDPKPFDVLAAAQEALDEVRGRITRAKGKTKGLKFSNKDPAPKSEAMRAPLEKRKGKETEKAHPKKRRAMAEAKALTAEEEFAEKLLLRWPVCKQSLCGGSNCFISASGLHVALTHDAIQIWSMANRENPFRVDIDTPPNHATFQPSLVGVKPVTRIPLQSNKYKDKDPKPKSDTKDIPAKKAHNSPDWMGKGTSVSNPICLDLSSPVAGPSKCLKLKREPSYIDISSSSAGSVNGSIASTRLPSPAELFEFLVAPRIETLLRGIDANYPDFHILDFAPHLHAHGIERVDQVPEHSVNWIVDNIHLPTQVASLIHSSALSYLRK